MQILFLSKWFPYPTNNGSKLRIYNLLRGLAAQHEVTLICFDDESTADPQVPELHAICKEIHIVPWKEYDPQSRKARLGFFSMTPRSYIDTFSSQMQTHIEQTLSSGDYDLVIASEWEMASYGPYIRDTTALFEDIELGVLYGQYAATDSFSQRWRRGLTWLKHQRYLSRLLSDFDACTVPSHIELELLRNTVPDFKNTTVIPNCISLADYSTVRTEIQPYSLIFTGSFRYGVNYDAMVWFLQNVYPLVLSEVPEVHLTITGDHAGQILPSTTGVTQTGFVPDVRPLIASSWASVVPLLSGGGTRLKILEAMALRTPVITTTKGAEGVDVKHGDSVLIADEPAEFAAAVVQLLREPELRDHLADNAYQLVSKQYDWAGVMPRFMQLIDEVVWAARR